jgi:hypothetical protein
VKTRKLKLPRGLSRAAAYRAASRKIAKAKGGDFRGLTYNKRTGRATVT